MEHKTLQQFYGKLLAANLTYFGVKVLIISNLKCINLWILLNNRKYICYCLIMRSPQNTILHEINALVICSLNKKLVIIIPSKKEQLLNSTAKPKPSLNLHNRIVCKHLEILLYLWNIGKKKVKK